MCEDKLRTEIAVRIFSATWTCLFDILFSALHRPVKDSPFHSNSGFLKEKVYISFSYCNTKLDLPHRKHITDLAQSSDAYVCYLKFSTWSTSELLIQVCKFIITLNKILSTEMSKSLDDPLQIANLSENNETSTDAVMRVHLQLPPHELTVHYIKRTNH